jgi:RND family efflux transporter MFP subunit
MNTDKINKKMRSPLLMIMLTVIITLIVGGGAAYFSGYFGLKPHKDHAENNFKSVKDNKSTLYSCGMHPWVISKEPGDCPICGMKLTPKRDSTVKEKKERQVAYWRAPMNPSEVYDKPGKSAMGMDLVPVYEDDVSGGSEIAIDPVTQQNMGIRTGRVEHGPLIHTIRTYGHITYDETRLARISPKYSGWVEKLYVDFTGQFIEKGQVLFEIYSPELVTAQEEYLEAYKNLNIFPGERGKKLLSSVKKKLAYLDVSDAEIRNIETSGKVTNRLTIRSPFRGFVTNKNAVQGGFVQAGTTIYEIADLSRVWVEAHIYEYELNSVKLGQSAEMTLPYLPGRVYSGKVMYVYPYLQKKTRDVVIRLEFENFDLELKPEMYADVRIKIMEEKQGLIIPSESVIRSGERNIVFVTKGDGKFIPREVTLGISIDGGKVCVISGLAKDEVIVTSGQFLLDSESKLKEAVQKMLEPENIETKKTHEIKDEFFKDME